MTMTHLADQPCVACRPGARQVADSEHTALLEEIPDWQVAEVDGVPQLTRTFVFPDFARALGFTNELGALAEDADHHPAILTEYGRVTVRWWTHVISGLHHNDFVMAARTDRVFAGL